MTTGLVKNRPFLAAIRRRRVLFMICGCCAALMPRHFKRAYGPISTASAETRQAPLRRSFSLRIEKRKLVGSPNTLRVIKGEIVELQWTSDEATTLHLHGYNLELPLAPDQPGVMTLDAYATGRFPVEAHGFKGAPRKPMPLLYLEVHPR